MKSMVFSWLFAHLLVPNVISGQVISIDSPLTRNGVQYNLVINQAIKTAYDIKPYHLCLEKRRFSSMEHSTLKLLGGNLRDCHVAVTNGKSSDLNDFKKHEPFHWTFNFHDPYESKIEQIVSKPTMIQESNHFNLQSVNWMTNGKRFIVPMRVGIIEPSDRLNTVQYDPIEYNKRLWLAQGSESKRLMLGGIVHSLIQFMRDDK